MPPCTLFFFYKNQFYKNLRLQIAKKLGTCSEHWKASFLQKLKNIRLDSKNLRTFFGAIFNGLFFVNSQTLYLFCSANHVSLYIACIFLLSLILVHLKRLNLLLCCFIDIFIHFILNDKLKLIKNVFN